MNDSNAHANGQRYLTEGRLTIRSANRAGGVVANVRDDNGIVYRAELTSERRWACNCPGLADCAHLEALRLITAQPEPSA